MDALEVVVPGPEVAQTGRPGETAPADSEIHVWFGSLERASGDVARFAEMLSGDEKARAARFHFERDRRRFVVARGWLRTILAGYLEAAPGDLVFRYGEFGKPRLSDPADLRFNLSHSDERVICVVTRRQEIGVDLERVRRVPEMDELAAQVFSAREQAAYRSVAPHRRATAFFNGWTRKEAYIKAIGDGLSCPLERFDVSLIPDQPARLLGVEGDPGAPDRWTLHAWEPEPGYAAALALEGRGWRIVSRDRPADALEP